MVMLEKKDIVLCPVLTFQAAEACGTLEIDSALDTVGSLGRDLEAYEKSAEDGKLLPLPGDTVSCTGRHIFDYEKQLIFVCYFYELVSCECLLVIFNSQAESCGLELGATSKSVGSSMAQLLTAASQVAEYSAIILILLISLSCSV